MLKFECFSFPHSFDIGRIISLVFRIDIFSPFMLKSPRYLRAYDLEPLSYLRVSFFSSKATLLLLIKSINPLNELCFCGRRKMRYVKNAFALLYYVIVGSLLYSKAHDMLLLRRMCLRIFRIRNFYLLQFYRTVFYRSSSACNLGVWIPRAFSCAVLL